MSEKLATPPSIIFDHSSEMLEGLYTFKGQEDVAAFLEVHPFLVQLLLEAAEKIKLYFPQSSLFLRKFNNPETTDDAYLLVLIGTKYGPKETLERLDKLEDEWWLDTIQRTEGKLSINVTFL